MDGQERCRDFRSGVDNSRFHFVIDGNIVAGGLPDAPGSGSQ